MKTIEEIMRKKVKPYFDFSPDGKTIKRSAVNSVLIQMILKMKGLITLPVFTYFLLPKEMGLFNIISITAALLAPAFTLNLPDGSVLFFAQAESPPAVRKMYMTVINSVGLFSIFLGLTGAVFIVAFKPELMGQAFWVGLVLYPMIFYKLFEFLLATFQKTELLLKNVFIRDAGIALLSMALVVLRFSYKGLILAGSFFFIIMGGALCWKIFRNFSYSFIIDASSLKSILKISLPLLPVFFFSWIIQSSDSYFLMHFQGESTVGKYSVVYGLCNMILILTFALNFFWFPVSARLWTTNRERYRKAFISVFAGFCLLLFLGVLLFEFNSDVIMRIMARNPEYRDAHIIMGIIAFAFAMQVLITLLTAPLYSNRNSSMIFLSYLCGGLLNALLNFAIIPKYGILGAAISTALSYLLVVLIMAVLNYRIARFPFLDKRLYWITGSFLTLWAAVAILKGRLDTLHLLVGDVILLLGLGTLVYIFVLKNEEKGLLLSFFNELKNGTFFKNSP